MVGDTDAIVRVHDALWNLGFTAEVFKKTRKQEKEKGVDIALTKDLLSNAFLNNYNVAVIMSGDAHYQPVIAEIKRLGKTVCIMTVTEGAANVNPFLRRSADYYTPMDEFILRFWSSHEAEG